LRGFDRFRSERTRSRSGLEIGELFKYGLDVLLEQRCLRDDSHDLGRNREGRIGQVVSDVGGHHEVSDSDSVASSIRAFMGIHVLPNDAVEQSSSSNVLLSHGCLLIRSCKQNSSKSTHDIGKSVNNFVSHNGLTVVSRVIVSIADTKVTENSSHLTEGVLFAILSETGLRESTKLAAFATGLLGSPFGLVDVDLSVWLSMILEHLSEWVSAAHAFKVAEGQILDDSFTLIIASFSHKERRLFEVLLNFLINRGHSLGMPETVLLLLLRSSRSCNALTHLAERLVS